MVYVIWLDCFYSKFMKVVFYSYKNIFVLESILQYLAWNPIIQHYGTYYYCVILHKQAKKTLQKENQLSNKFFKIYVLKSIIYLLPWIMTVVETDVSFTIPYLHCSFIA